MKRQTIFTFFLLMFFLCFMGDVITGCVTWDKRNDNSEGDIENPPAVSMKMAKETSEENSEDSVKRKAVVTLHAVGRGIAPEDATSKGQAIILGESAARANGYVKLAEKIYGVYVDSYRRLGRGIVDYEIVHQETQALLKGAEVLEYRQLEHGIYEVYMEVKVIVSHGHPLYPAGS